MKDLIKVINQNPGLVRNFPANWHSSENLEQLISYKCTETGKTILHSAAENGHKNIVDQFLENRNININIKDIRGNFPLHLAVLNNKNEIVKSFLNLNNKEITNISDKYGNSPLSLAIQQNHINLAKTILDNDTAEINTRNNENKTPAYYYLQRFNSTKDILNSLVFANYLRKNFSKYKNAKEIDGNKIDINKLYSDMVSSLSDLLMSANNKQEFRKALDIMPELEKSWQAPQTQSHLDKYRSSAGEWEPLFSNNGSIEIDNKGIKYDIYELTSSKQLKDIGNLMENCAISSINDCLFKNKHIIFICRQDVEEKRKNIFFTHYNNLPVARKEFNNYLNANKLSDTNSFSLAELFIEPNFLNKGSNFLMEITAYDSLYIAQHFSSKNDKPQPNLSEVFSILQDKIKSGEIKINFEESQKKKQQRLNALRNGTLTEQAITICGFNPFDDKKWNDVKMAYNNAELFKNNPVLKPFFDNLNNIIDEKYAKKQNLKNLQNNLDVAMIKDIHSKFDTENRTWLYTIEFTEKIDFEKVKEVYNPLNSDLTFGKIDIKDKKLSFNTKDKDLITFIKECKKNINKTLSEKILENYYLRSDHKGFAEKEKERINQDKDKSKERMME